MKYDLHNDDERKRFENYCNELLEDLHGVEPFWLYEFSGTWAYWKLDIANLLRNPEDLPEARRIFKCCFFWICQ